MNLYVIGAVTGKEHENRPKFIRAQKALTEAGHIVYIPHEIVPSDHELSRLWGFCMKHSLKHIITQYDCYNEPPTFGIAMLDDWRNSTGARIEHDLAEALGIPCKPWEEWLK